MGKVIQVIGAAVDIQFDQDHLPAIENAIEIEMENGKGKYSISHSKQKYN